MSFKKVAKDNNDNVEDIDYPYEKLIVDSDTAVFRASKFVQEDYVVVTHLPSKRDMEFPNKTAFYGHWKKKEGGWLGEKNKERVEKELAPFPIEDFEVKECVRLVDEIDNHIEEGVKNFDFFVGSLKQQKLAPEYILGIGGKGNYRYDVSETLAYKGNRADKPILFEEIREAILTKYKNRVEITDGKEVDDQLAVYGRENYLHHKKTGEWKYCLAYIDKDINMVISPSVNFDNFEEGVKIPTEFEAAMCYCKQLLIGDLSTDNIQGLTSLSNEIREKYGVRKGRGVGATTALNLLKSCETIKELFERVVEAYRDCYGDDPFTMTTHRGETKEVTWKDKLQEVALLVYMNPLDDPLEYNIFDTLDRLGVEYE